MLQISSQCAYKLGGFLMDFKWNKMFNETFGFVQFAAKLLI